LGCSAGNSPRRLKGPAGQWTSRMASSSKYCKAGVKILSHEHPVAGSKQVQRPNWGGRGLGRGGLIARFTQIDYARAMALIAIDEASGRMLGVVRLHANANYDTSEYAVLVRSDMKGKGLGWLLMQTIMEYSRAEGLKTIEDRWCARTFTMLAMCRELGFDHDRSQRCGRMAGQQGYRYLERFRHHGASVSVQASSGRRSRLQPGRARAETAVWSDD
jgi:GNAT superfamily N-acetyltransferase